MRAVPAGAVLSSELLWWELLLDSSQCWGNRLKSFSESCNSVLGPVKNDVAPCRQAQFISSAARSVDNGENAAENISRVSDGALTMTPKRFRKLFPEAHEGLRNTCGSVRAVIQEGSIKAAAKSNVFAGSIASDLYSRSSAREGLSLVSSGCLKETRGIGLSAPSIMFGRAMSTSTEKQCDEDAGEQQSSIQQSSSQQQSSLEIPQSKPEGGPSWPNPDNAASYVLMSNIYADGDRWDEVKRINEMRLKARAWKKPGKAYVEIKAKVHEFIVGDRTHQDSTNIYEKLRKIKRHMGHIGYVPNVDLILENRSHYDPYKPR
eukprot:c21025_g1_i1 orf=611-1567(-)